MEWHLIITILVALIAGICVAGGLTLTNRRTLRRLGATLAAARAAHTVAPPNRYQWHVALRQGERHIRALNAALQKAARQRDEAVVVETRELHENDAVPPMHLYAHLHRDAFARAALYGIRDSLVQWSAIQRRAEQPEIVLVRMSANQAYAAGATFDRQGNTWVTHACPAEFIDTEWTLSEFARRWRTDAVTPNRARRLV